MQRIPEKYIPSEACTLPQLLFVHRTFPPKKNTNTDMMEEDTYIYIIHRNCVIGTVFSHAYFFMTEKRGVMQLPSSVCCTFAPTPPQHLSHIFPHI